MHAIGMLAMLAVDISIALTLNVVRSMMWFNNSWLVVPFYMLPAISAWIITHQHGKDIFYNLFQVRIVSIVY